MSMKVFISHPFADEQLASVLKETLEENGISAYMAQRVKEYELKIDQKVIDEINDSDYVVAIITNNTLASASVNQELGYAQGKDVPRIAMIEKNAQIGVLLHGIDSEDFTRVNFQDRCNDVKKYLLKKGIRKKLSKEKMDELIKNVYEPCYDIMKNIFDTRDSNYGVPKDPWKSVSNAWKLKTENEIKQLFKKYSENQQIYHDMWVDYANEFQGKRGIIGEIFRPAFEKFNLIKEDGYIPLSKTSSIDLGNFMEYLQDIIYNDDVNNAEEFYEILHDHAKKTKWGYLYLLEKWKDENPELYFEILQLIPKLVKELDLQYSYQEVDRHRKILKKSIEELTMALEGKL